MAAQSPRVLFVAAEAFPMAKAGGLGDVAGALPVALRRRGIDVRLMMPAYPSAMPHVQDVTAAIEFDDVQGLGPVQILEAETVRDRLPVWLVRSERYFERPGGPYGDEIDVRWPDDLERFALLCNATARFIGANQAWRPTLVHLNDWHTALIPSLLRAQQPGGPPCLLTIHNAFYQGHASIEQLRSFGVPAEHIRAVPAHARSFLAVGVRHADRLNAVSPKYAKEIQTKKFGCGLDPLFRARSRELTGILNGVDYGVWDPAHDELIAQTYNASDLAGKARCRAALLEEMKLDTASTTPLLGVVSRLTPQKGLDLVLRVAGVLVKSGARLVVLGRGDAELEEGFRALAERYPNRVAVNIGYDEHMAHRIMAGSDIFLMPSRFEPCGLNQMYSLRYGTVPIVNPVGGLADSVVDAGQRGIAKGATTGFAMRRFGLVALTGAVGKAMAVYPDRQRWKTLQLNGMRQDFSWDRAAAKYQELYALLAPGR